MFRLAAMTGLTFWAESYALAASDFWIKKKPSEWTDKEKEELRTKSPWAKKVDAEMGAGGGGGSRGGGGGGSRGGGGGGEEGGGGEGGGGGGGRGGGRGGGGVAPAGSFGGQTVSLEIVWESAKPIQDAHPLPLGSKLENHYVIAVTGIPQQVLNAAMLGRAGGRGGSGERQFGGGGGRSGGGGRDAGGFSAGQAGSGPPPESAAGAAGPPAPPADPTAGLRRGATLTVKGKEPQHSDVVMSMNNNTTVFFGFARDALALTVADKEVEFDVKLGGLSGKAKFTLKDMMYQEELAL